jgi:glutamate synthase (NADPH/NADH) small chain
MADPKGFLTTPREQPRRRPVDVRIQDFGEVYERAEPALVRRQAGRCMDCGVPFCHNGCPLGNLIPEWNDLVHRDDWSEASERLHATNNFPEFTGRLCPAPCEAACVLTINSDAVSIKVIEQAIADRAYDEGWFVPRPPDRLSGRTVAVIGSGPAGLAAAQQLTRAGHTVALYERDDRIGGLLRYGIPDFKMDREHIDRRLDQMRAEGTVFRAGVHVGVDITGEELRRRYDAIVIATGATVPRELPVPGIDLTGVLWAMDYLVDGNRVVAGDQPAPIVSAEGKHVVIIGGGDTGADCVGTAHRQQPSSVTQLQINPQPPDDPDESTPWPTWPLVMRSAPAYEEGGDRVFAMSTVELMGDELGRVRAVALEEVRKVGFRRYEPVPGSRREIPADLVLLALGFTGPERGLLDQLEVQVERDGTIQRDASYRTSASGVFAAGDAGRGQSLVVWAIAEGRAAAAEVDRFLTGDTSLPFPLPATAKPLTA